jgi:hypothetical protein
VIPLLHIVTMLDHELRTCMVPSNMAPVHPVASFVLKRTTIENVQSHSTIEIQLNKSLI